MKKRIALTYNLILTHSRIEIKNYLAHSRQSKREIISMRQPATAGALIYSHTCTLYLGMMLELNSQIKLKNTLKSLVE